MAKKNTRGCICGLCIFAEKDFRRGDNSIWCCLKMKYQKEYHFCTLGIKRDR